MVETYIVSIEDFEKRSSISRNLLTDRFKQESGISQEMFAIKILCNDQYDLVIQEVSADNISPETEALLPYLKDYLVFKIAAAYLVDCNYIATPAGLRTQIDDTSSTVSQKEMAQIIKKQDQRADFYQDRLVNFLTVNKDDYPLWLDSNCGCSNSVRVQKANTFSKIGANKKRNKINWT